MTTILGGGISGLSAAFYALENPKLGALTLLEASNRLGGWIRTNRSSEGILFEKGPRTVRPAGEPGKNTLELVDKLGLADAIIPVFENQPASKKRLIYVNKKMALLPTSITSLFTIRKPFRRPLITAFWNDFKAPQEIKDDESMYDFVSRRLGKDIADYLVSPMLCGICAGDAKKISVRFLLDSMFEAEQKYGSIRKGMMRKNREELEKKMEEKRKELENMEKKPIGIYEELKGQKCAAWSLQNGLDVLPKTISEHLSGGKVKIQMNSRCNNITFKPDCVELEINGKLKKCSRVVSTLSAKDLSPLVQRQHPQLARELDEIPSVTVATINFHFNGNVMPIEAFGVLVPPCEKLPILGIIFDSCIFPQGSSTVLTVMMGGAWFEHYFGKNPTKEHLLSIAQENLRTILNIKDDPVDVDVAILKDCIPQHIVGHKQRINRIREYISSNGIPLTLCGSSFDGIGINDVILSAKNAIADIAGTKEEESKV